MKDYLKAKVVAALKAAAQAAVTALLTALGIGVLSGTSGCTTVITPTGETPTVSVTGAVPIGVQLNMDKANDNN